MSPLGEMTHLDITCRACEAVPGRFCRDGEGVPQSTHVLRLQDFRIFRIDAYRNACAVPAHFQVGEPLASDSSNRIDRN